MSETLFDGYEPAEVIPEPKLSADRRRTKRQAENNAGGPPTANRRGHPPADRRSAPRVGIPSPRLVRAQG